MGQNISADASEIIQFRKMVKATYSNNVKKLKKNLHIQAIGFQISRASYLELCSRIEGRIQSISDTKQRTMKMEKYIQEKMEFFSAIEKGTIVLGDTLLHLGVRLGHVETIGFLLENRLQENIPNFRGEYANQVCTHPSIQLLLDDVVLVHDILGYEYEEEPKVHRMIQSLRRIWTHWMFDATETPLLVQVIGEVRSSHPFLNKYLTIANTLAERYRHRITRLCLPVAISLLQEHDVKPYEAKRAFLAWSTDEKLDLMWDIYQATFPRWCHKKDVEKDVATLHFIEDAMSAWINIADELRLYLDDAQLPQDEILLNFDRQIWKKRLGPDPQQVQDLCAHINGIEKFVRQKNLKA